LPAQLIAFVAVRLAIPAISRHVQEGQVASGVFLGAVAIALGILNAAAMTS
jgi:putative membrane protein